MAVCEEIYGEEAIEEEREESKQTSGPQEIYGFGGLGF